MEACKHCMATKGLLPMSSFKSHRGLQATLGHEGLEKLLLFFHSTFAFSSTSCAYRIPQISSHHHGSHRPSWTPCPAWTFEVSKSNPKVGSTNVFHGSFGVRIKNKSITEKTQETLQSIFGMLGDLQLCMHGQALLLCSFHLLCVLDL